LQAARGLESEQAAAVFAGMTWFFYLRKSVATKRVPSLAYASV